ncbi:bis(5'-nucleosyl)-tetraphosphatase [asymmetrical] [Bombus vosnesenskii]|uniref:Bis(5'-nucleosyl)-tetraphosphatase [asymmetrical] n=1 Tax=Bombus vosnesenskii TaxID=207650 RepID=A0A6J3KRT9_9HYME|nr:bis(5'-nucleosyl)-tetraphosphatase [asymmetrical] [Bombus vosnesenskii]XP_050482398.1 bis(5'-nucleosyl)-tetraphosphatase [asymmetrical] [Bombus huntii]XP_050482399.1 bis(5'-nucleosyl)-tetraphosphatase [asymmetrical] [Bombus huntii]
MTARACGFVVFRRVQGIIEYLLMQVSYGTHHWTPPKGHVDPGESDMEAALRETEEEAGLLVNDLNIFENVKEEQNYEANGKPKIVIYWLAELLDPEKPIRLSHEHQAFKWLPLEEACSIAKYKEMQNTLRNFNDYILKNLS